MPLIKIGISQILQSSGGWRIKTIKLLDWLIGSFLALLAKERGETAILAKDIKDILIIRPGGIGDAVFLLPILRRLAQEHPNIAVDILCENRNSQIFSAQTALVRKIYRYDDLRSFYSLFSNHPSTPARDGEQKANHYSLVIDTEQWHYLSSLIGSFLRPKFFIGFATRPLRAKLFDFKIPYELDAYELLNFQRLFTPLFPEDPDLKISGSYEIPETLAHWATDTISEATVAFSIGASIPERRLEPKITTDIIRLLLDRNYRVVLLGGKDVQKRGEEIQNQLNDARVMNFVGKISLAESAAIIKQSQLFIGPDSGLLHLASAVGTPVVAIFGPGNLRKWGPQEARDAVVTDDLPCSPCTTFGYTIPTCQHRYPCMRSLETKDIWTAIEKQLHI